MTLHPMQVLGVRALQPHADRLSLGELPLRRNRRRFLTSGRLLLAVLAMLSLALVLGAVL